MSKYIVKNCPAIINGLIFKNSCSNADGNCQDCTDCLIKQVINKCTVTLEVFDKHKDENLYAQGRCATTENILQLFEIEECNDEVS